MPAASGWTAAAAAVQRAATSTRADSSLNSQTSSSARAFRHLRLQMSYFLRAAAINPGPKRLVGRRVLARTG